MNFNHMHSVMDPETAAYWLDRAKADVAERDVLIQNQRNEIDRLTRNAQELTYNACMQNAIIAYEVKQFAQQRAMHLPVNSAQNHSGGSLAVVSLADLDSFLSQLTGGILETSSSSQSQQQQVQQPQQQIQQQPQPAQINVSASQVTRFQLMQQRFAKRCRDEHEPDMRPMRPGQWNVQQDVYS